MTKSCCGRSILLTVLAFSILCSAAGVVMGQTQDLTAAVRVERTISTAHALPGSTFRVIVRFEALEDLIGVGVREVLPLGWQIHPIESEGAAFKRTENEWVFPETLEARSRHTLIYEVTVPPADRLFADPLPACFEISGIFQITLLGQEIPIPGDSVIEIVSALPISTAIAHLVPGTIEAPDRVDLRLDRYIDDSQINRAIELWATDYVVPWTDGEIIDLATLEKLSARHQTCTKADDPLPLSMDPDLVAVRSINTFLPCDSVLLPEGCLDPGLPARRFEVAVEITGSFDAYGVGLAEWLPENWRVTPIEHDGFAYRRSRTEWIYPGRLRAGETLSVSYLVEVQPTALSALDTFGGCCGEDATFTGFATSGLECSEADVAGESSVYVWECLPVLLAISRWDVEEDRLDATLSDFISFPQVQRAVEFWLTGTAVPHTCGYTVGYHMLKRIIAHWLGGVSVTDPLPDDAAAVCGDPEDGCYESACPDGGLCRLSELQRDEDYVGIPQTPRLSLQVDGVSELTCATPSTVLRVAVDGGTEPFRFEWRGPRGDLLGTSDTLTVTEPGVYSAIVESVGGCEVGQRVIITGDFEAPQIQINVSGVLGCSTPEVTLVASLLGGRSPFGVRWFDERDRMVAEGTELMVDEPGAYTVVAVGSNGCSQRATAHVLEDRQIPVVAVSASGILTCAVPSVDLTASVSGDRPPYSIVWHDASGASVGTGATVSVQEPGTYTAMAVGAGGCSSSESVTVLQSIEPPIVTVGPIDELTCVVTEVALSARMEGGEPPYAVVWNDPSGIPIGEEAEIMVQTPGVYSVVVTGANGCSAAASVTVTQDITAPSVDASVDGVLTCDTAKVQVHAQISGGREPYTILWSDESESLLGSAKTLSVDEPGVYTVIVRGANGCSSSSSVTVTQDLAAPTAEASASGEITCATPEITLQVAVSEGRTPYSIVWTDSSGLVLGTTETAQVGAPGTYTVTVTGSNGCSSSDVVTVSQDIAEPVVVVSAGGELTCTTTEVTLQAQISDGRPPYDVEWRNPAGVVVGDSQMLSVDLPGTYRVLVTGANGCSSTGVVTVSQDIAPPIVEASASGEINCADTKVVLQAQIHGGREPYEIVWSSESGEEIGTLESVRVDTPGAYGVVVTGANGCSSSDVVIVTQDVEAPDVTASASAELTCATTVVTLMAQIGGGRSPYTVAWRNAAGIVIGDQPSVSVDSPGTYAVTVTGANGCSSNESVTVTQDVVAPAVSASVSEALTCAVTSVTLSAQVDRGRPPYAIEWTDSACVAIGNTTTVSVGTPGIYTVTVTGTNGCSSSAQVTVSQDIAAPGVEAAVSGQLTCDTTSVTLSAQIEGGRLPYEIIWSSADSVIIGNGSSVAVGEPGIYTVKVTGANGCVTSDSITVVEDLLAPSVQAVVSGQLSCSTPSVTLSATVFDGRAPFDCVWSDCCGTEIGYGREIAVSLSGTYVVTVTGQNGCSNSASVEVVEDLAAPSVEASASGELSCSVGKVTLTAIVSGGRPPYALSWIDPNGVTMGSSTTIDVCDPGIYTVTAAGQNGCFATAAVTVSENVAVPVFDLGEDRVLTCAEPEILLSAMPCECVDPFTYLWLDSCDQILGSSAQLLVDLPGIYRVTVTGPNGCSASDLITITNGVRPPSVDLGPDRDLVCCGDEMVLDSSVTGGMQPYTYEWRDDCDAFVGDQPTLTITQAGSYLLIVRTADGCMGSDTVVVR